MDYSKEKNLKRIVKFTPNEQLQADNAEALYFAGQSQYEQDSINKAQKMTGKPISEDLNALWESATPEEDLNALWESAGKPVAPSVTPQRRSTDTGFAQGLVAGAANIGKNLISASTFIPRKIEQLTTSMAGVESPLNEAVANMQQGNEDFVKSQEGKTGFGAGKLITEIAGTAGAGNVLGIAAKASKLPKLASALESGGLTLKSPVGKTLAEKGVNAATRIAGGAGAGAGTMAMIDPENIKTGAVIGGAFPVVGKVAGEAGKKLGKALSANVAPEVVKLAEKAKSLGINIPADRLVNSKPLNAVASSLNYVPFSGRAKTEELFEKQLNTALSKTFGQNTDNVTMGLRKAADDLGRAFDNTLKSNNVRFDKQLLDDITNTQNQAATELSDSSLQIINRQIDDIFKKGESGVIDGQAAYNIKRTLDRIGKGNTPEAYHARQLKKDLMSGLDRSLGAEGAKKFAKVRKQYGTMMDLENIAQNGAEGGISIARLANMKNINNPELQDLADIAAQFLKPREGQHGAMQRVLVGGVAGSTVGLPALAGGAVAGRLTNKALNSEVAKKLALGQVKAPNISPKAISVARTVPIASLYE